MKIRLNVFAVGLVLACLVAGSDYAQQISGGNNTSLGDIARQLKAQKVEERKPAWVITNDNLPGLIEEASGCGASSNGMSSAGSACSSPSREDRGAAPQGSNQGTDSLGFVQTADGKIETVVADGDTIRLVPRTPTVTMARVPAPGDSQAGASPAQGSTTPAAAVIAARGAVTNIPAHPEGRAALPLPSAIRNASYRVLTPAASVADASGIGQLGGGLAGEAAGPMGGATGPTASTIVQKPSGSTGRMTKVPVSIKPLGFVVKADGEFAAVLSQGDEIYIVRQGDLFAGHYRAVSVSADAVEAVEEPPTEVAPLPFEAPPTFPGLLSAWAQQGPSRSSKGDCLICNSKEFGEVSRKLPGDPPAEVASFPSRKRRVRRVHLLPVKWPWQMFARPFKQTAFMADNINVVFQTLGYVETKDGELQAIVADGPDVYLVKQGETFADKYRATSVDATLVLAVRVSPRQEVGNLLSAKSEFGGKIASKKLYGYLQYPVLGRADAQTFHEADATGGPVLTDLGVILLKSPLAGYDF